MKSAAIVLAAGSGKRMKSDTPKQYLPLCGKPVLYYSLKAFEDSEVDEIILVTSEADVSYCKSEIIDKYQISKVSQIVCGGAERYDSVYNGIKALVDADYVLIHDGARPLISIQMIHKLIEEVKQVGACVAAVPVKDTIKVSDEKGYALETPDRKTLWQIQTPQVFEYSLIKEAYEQIYTNTNQGKSITDDAMVVETFTDKKVKLIEGEYTNLKITTPEDLTIAEALIKGL